jgi:ribulose-phosphate 3-epimerase
MKIVPAIYPEIFEEVVDKLYALIDLTDFVQIVICDGSNGMRQSWDPRGILPDNFDYEFDLNLVSWREYVLKASSMGVKNVVVHIDQFTDSDFNDLCRLVSSHHLILGIAISNDVSIDILISAVRKIETSRYFFNPDNLFIQVTGVKNLNGDSHHFDERVLHRVRVLKKLFPKYQLQVSGRINPDTAGAVREAGADRLVSGSYIFGHEDLAEAIETLLKAAALPSKQEEPQEEKVKEVESPLTPVTSYSYGKADSLEAVKPEVKKQERTGEKYKASEDEIVYVNNDADFYNGEE